MTYPVVDPLLLRNAALSIRTMAAMMSAGTVRDSGLYYADELSKAAARIEVQPYATGGNG
jgi:hypothetical protein